MSTWHEIGPLDKFTDGNQWLIQIDERDLSDVLVIVGGIIPEGDKEQLYDLGITQIFGPGTPTSEIVDFIKDAVPN